MSYVALATQNFDEVTQFYREVLGFDVVTEWDRPRGRGTRFDLGGGLRLEILDNSREPVPRALGEGGDRVHVVVEVDDVHATWSQLSIDAPAPAATSWGASLFGIRDPDGTAITFLQWTTSEGSRR
ncbi:hypothetical protein MMAD_18240 [Mycolicibacterium madagascariense]|uniref:VOC domain-containing protein n=1 Tax=Mycolicibacterium madagascariense TaxID=212765 RepID=A0A7I7XCP0_9MYCO|nr:VOC family protein [Mycolicibacterium madagascariense]MCV7015236.1 VOC family protein [Mycolicibacterium madagascariense]BBZ27529.1 hypothetical protein MMAD_18240 [Mycolicibacterium madagascariense]